MLIRCVCVLIWTSLFGLAQVSRIILGGQIVQAESLDSSLAVQTQADQDSLRTQKKINALADETARMLQEYQDAKRNLVSMVTGGNQL